MDQRRDEFFPDYGPGNPVRRSPFPWEGPPPSTRSMNDPAEPRMSRRNFWGALLNEAFEGSGARPYGETVAEYGTRSRFGGAVDQSNLDISGLLGIDVPFGDGSGGIEVSPYYRRFSEEFPGGSFSSVESGIDRVGGRYQDPRLGNFDIEYHTGDRNVGAGWEKELGDGWKLRARLGAPVGEWKRWRGNLGLSRGF